MLDINPQKETERIIDFIKKTLKKAEKQKLVIGLSGGLDSSVVAILAQKAISAKNLLIFKLPYGKLSKDKDVDLVIRQLRIPQSSIFEIDIKPAVDCLKSLINGKKQKMDKVRLGNIMSRVRMIILYDFAKKNNALVCGTENKSEYLLGYFTLHGDSASDIEPIRHLFKTQVILLAKYLSVPEKIIKKPATAGLWPGQTDEGELGFSYKEADPILHLFFDKKETKNEIKNKGFKESIINKIIPKVLSNSFKRESFGFLL